MTKSYQIWMMNEEIEIKEEQRVFIGTEFNSKTSKGGGKTYGEHAILKKATKQHLVFLTESGGIIKTKKDSLQTIGNAGHYNLFVSLRIRKEDEYTNYSFKGL